MTDAREHLLDWLRDAHAMEQQAEQMLKAQAARIEHYPELKARIEQHIEETLGQQALPEGCITRLGSSPSRLKDAMGKVAAMGQAIGGMVASDEIVKGSMAGYVFEHMEIASYRTLIAAAEAARRPGDAGGLRADPGRGGSDGALAAGPPAGRHPAVPGARRYPRGHGEEVVVAT